MTFRLLAVLSVGLTFSLSALSATIPQAGDNPIVIDQLAVTDNITYLMAGGAARPDTTTVRSFGAPKHAWLQGVDNTENLEWRVETAVGGNFVVRTLMAGNSGQTFQLEVLGSSNSISFSLDEAGWQRNDSGVIFIPAGVSTLRFKRISNDGDINLKSIELIEEVDYSDYQDRVAAFSADTSKLSDSRYGVMFQYGPWGYPQSGDRKNINDQAADFDVPAFIDKVKGTGAEYVIWSISWINYRVNAPISAIDEIVGHSDRTSNRDLLGDIAVALEAEGIDLYFYYHAGQEGTLPLASRDWWTAQNFPSTFPSTGTGDKTTFFNNWISVITEMGNRYGRLLDGWFIDGGLNYYPAPYEAMGKAAQAGNPDRLLAHNPWVVTHYTDFEHMEFGEHCSSGNASVGGDGLYRVGKDAGVYGHCMFTMEQTWGVSKQNEAINSNRFTANSAIARVENASARRVPTSFNMMMYEDGTMSQTSLNILKAVKTNVGPGCGGNCEVVNNDSSDISYVGNWRVSNNRGHGDYKDDLHYVRNNGSYFEYDFRGDGIAVYMPEYNAGGKIEVFIDGVSHGITDVFSPVSGAGMHSQDKVFEARNLGSGSHTLRVVKRSGPYMQLDRLDVLGVVGVDGGSVPISQGRLATQTNTSFGGVASRAVDGNTSGSYSDRSVTHTAMNVSNPEWRVDLGSDVAIGDINVFNRTGCCSERLANFRVDILDSNNVQIWRSFHDAAPTKLELNANGAVGRYVRVTILGRGTLSLAEVQVYAD